jgi:hypothetical protein
MLQGPLDRARDIERGTRNVSLVNIERVATALSLPMSDLFRLVERH